MTTPSFSPRSCTLTSVTNAVAASAVATPDGPSQTSLQRRRRHAASRTAMQPEAASRRRDSLPAGSPLGASCAFAAPSGWQPIGAGDDGGVRPVERGAPAHGEGSSPSSACSCERLALGRHEQLELRVASTLAVQLAQLQCQRSNHRFAPARALGGGPCPRPTAREMRGHGWLV
jgi:hypothetical protein